MSDRELKHQNEKRLCYCCDTLQDSEDKLHILSVGHRGYGSNFDNFNTYMQLCDECIKRVNMKWFSDYEGDEEFEYFYEDEIEKFVSSFILENKEYFWNSNAYGACAHNMDRQDWLDYKRGIMPDKKYEEYGMYSPTQRRLYEERFTTCNHPINKIYDDGSKGCWCVFGAHGEYGQKVGYSMSEQCCKCNHYVERFEPIKEMTSSEYDLYAKYYIGKLNYLNLKEKFE